MFDKMPKLLLVLICCILSFSCYDINVHAFDDQCSTLQVSKDREDRLKNNIDLQFVSTEPKNDGIKRIAVSDNSKVAIGFGGYNEKIVSVYSSEGIFSHAFRFNCSGDYVLDWSDNYLLVFLIRSDIVLWVAPSGDIEKIAEMEDTSINRKYISKLRETTRYTVNGYVYEIKNDLGLFNVLTSSYSQLVVTSPKGVSNIVYDVTNIILLRVVITTVAVFLFCFILAFYLLKIIKSRKKFHT